LAFPNAPVKPHGLEVKNDVFHVKRWATLRTSYVGTSQKGDEKEEYAQSKSFAH
jgi:hypothetical protein